MISLLRLNVSQLITIGGDDTAFSAMKVEEQRRRAASASSTSRRPSTTTSILPPHVDTFGFQTARHFGVEIVKNLMVDAKTTSRWYFVDRHGPQGGASGAGIGKAAGATLTLIPEEFSARRSGCKTMVDTLAGAIIKRLSDGRRDGVAVIAEGVVLDIVAEDLAGLAGRGARRHGHLRIAEVNIGEILKAKVHEPGCAQLGVKTTIVAKNIGYELRCADPIPFDMEYTRDLGYCAAKYLLAGGNGAMVSMQGGHFVPDPVRGDARPRDRPRASAHGGHPLDPLRDRAALHDPPAPRRLRRSARAGEARGHGGAVSRPTSGRSSST